MYQDSFISCKKCTTLIHAINNRGKCWGAVLYIQELSVLCAQIFHKPKIALKNTVCQLRDKQKTSHRKCQAQMAPLVNDAKHLSKKYY